MNINLHTAPDTDIFRDKKKYTRWFSYFLGLAVLAVALGFYAITVNGNRIDHLDNWALGVLVFSAMGVTRYGNRLQEYKTLFPPQLEKLAALRAQYPVLDSYCAGVEQLQRRFIRAEYEACVEYAAKEEIKQEREQSEKPVVYGPAEPEKCGQRKPVSAPSTEN
nr:hypothetical protein [uncultured Desulfobulbus sp.]